MSKETPKFFLWVEGGLGVRGISVCNIRLRNDNFLSMYHQKTYVGDDSPIHCNLRQRFDDELLHALPGNARGLKCWVSS